MTIFDEIYLKSSKAFNEQKQLYHHTSFNTLKIILESRKLRLSRLDKLKDVDEEANVDKIWNQKIFIVCFCNRLDNDYLWCNYPNIENGVCIDLGKIDTNTLTLYDSGNYNLSKVSTTDLKCTTYYKSNNWGIHNISGLKVFYTNNLCEYTTFNKELSDFFEGVVVNNPHSFNNHELQGYIKKSREYSFEEEFRIRVSVRPKGPENIVKGTDICPARPEFEHLYIDISQFTDFKILYKKGFAHKDELLKLCEKYNVNHEEIN